MAGCDPPSRLPVIIAGTWSICSLYHPVPTFLILVTCHVHTITNSLDKINGIYLPYNCYLYTISCITIQTNVFLNSSSRTYIINQMVSNYTIIVTQSRASVTFLYQDTLLYITTQPRSRNNFFTSFSSCLVETVTKIALFSSFALLLVVSIPLVVCHFTTMNL